MPDHDTHLDEQLTDLRTDLRNDVSLPHPAAILERHRQRRSRRRLQAGAVAAVLVVGALMPTLRSTNAAPATGGPPTADTTPTSTDDRLVTNLQFAADGTGYATRFHLPDDGPGEPIPPFDATLLTSSDGENWDEVGTIPIPERTDLYLIGDLTVLGPEELVVDWRSEKNPTSSASARIHSTDGGRTWQDVPMPDVVTEVVPAIPDHAELVPACSVDPTKRPPCTTPSFTVVLPGTGTSAVLANPPPLLTPVPGSLPTANGRWWAVGQQPDTKDWAITVSADDGRTWNTVTLDLDLANDSRSNNIRASVVSMDDSLYASFVGPVPNNRETLRGVFRSDDDGRTWRQTWTPAPDQDDLPVTGTLVAGDDGALRLRESPNLLTFTDGGTTLTHTVHLGLGMVGWTRKGYVSGWRSYYELSTDGINWTKYDLPME